MDIWIDNTGLISSGNALERRALHQIDVEGLLQLLTQIVFCRRIYLNAFEPPRVAERTLEVKDKLEQLGLDREVITTTVDDPTVYEEACRMAAQNCAIDLPEMILPDPTMAAFGPDIRILSDVQTNLRIWSATESNLPRIISRTFAGNSVERARDILIEKKAAAAVEYMLAVSPELRYHVSEFIKKFGDWTPAHDYLLNSFMRIYLNDALGDLKNAKYSPAIVRGRIIRRTNNLAFDRLQKALGEIAQKLSGQTLGLSSIAAALLSKSRGDPVGLVSEAIVLRDKAERVRSFLSDLSHAIYEDKVEGRFRLEQTITDWTNTIEKELGLQDAPKFRDALEIHFVVGLPLAELQGSKLAEWIEHRLIARRITILTDITKRAGFFGEAEGEYRKLCRRCLRG